jgi:hypothetical protein
MTAAALQARNSTDERFQTPPELLTIKLEVLSPTAIRLQLSGLPAPNELNPIIEKA